MTGIHLRALASPAADPLLLTTLSFLGSALSAAYIINAPGACPDIEIAPHEERPRFKLGNAR